MRKPKTIKSYDVSCDTCGATTYEWNKCMNCGQDFCDKHGKEFQHTLHFSGSGDGKYCNTCITALRKHPTPLFAAYDEIQSLRAESERVHLDIKRRAEIAEAKIRSLQP